MAPYIQFALGSDIGDDVKHDVGDDASCILMDSTIPNPFKGKVVGYKNKTKNIKIIPIS
jgi:hypothetical protein